MFWRKLMLLHCIFAFLSDWEKSVWSLKDGLSHFLTQVDATAVLNEGGKPFTHNKERVHSCSKAYFLWNLKRFHVISRVLLKLCQDPRSLVWQNSKIKKNSKIVSKSWKMGDDGIVFPDQTTSTSRPEEQPVRYISHIRQIQIQMVDI